MTLLLYLQLFVYLLLAPGLLYYLGENHFFFYDIAVVTIAAFSAGVFFESSLDKKPSPGNFVPSITKPLHAAIILLSILYVFVVLSNDLFYRRLGTEVMASLYAGLPLYQLLVLRIYEIIFLPCFLLMLLEARFLPSQKSIISNISKIFLFAGFLCTGVGDSRMRFIIPISLYLIFFYFPGKNRGDINGFVKIFVGVFSTIAVSIVAMSRVDFFYDLYSYLVSDVLKRLDGLELISRISIAGYIPFSGTLDFLVFSNFVASIPFLEDATELKAAGMTSSKQYLLKYILGVNEIDMNNSFVTDLFYFGGYPLLVIGSAGYGFLVKKVDTLLKGEAWLGSRAMLAMLMAFVINAFKIEMDFFGTILDILRDIPIIYIFLIGVSFVPMRDRKRRHEKNMPIFKRAGSRIIHPRWFLS